MQSIHNFKSIFIHTAPVDFRKSFNGLGAIVENHMNKNLFESSLFVFCCKRRKKIKILYWDKTGFALWYKKLETDRFPWASGDENITLSATELSWLLDGIDFFKLKPHSEKKYQQMN